MRLDKMMPALRRAGWLCALPLLLTACLDTNLPTVNAERVVVVLNSVGISLTVVPQGNPNVRTIGLGADGTPTTLAVRSGYAVVPMGVTNVVAVVDLAARTVVNVPLPAGSGATGVAFVNDSIALVANPGRNSVSPVNVLRGTAGAEIPVGVYPQAVLVEGPRVYVVNGNLSTTTFQPLGPGSVSVLNAATLAPVGTVALTGINPGSAAMREGTLFVLNSGTFGGNNSSLSRVNVTSLTEAQRIDGFGNFPGSVAAAVGRPVYVAVYSTGLLVYDPETNVMTRGLGNPLTPGNLVPISAVRFDSQSLLYTLHPGDCTEPGILMQSSPLGDMVAQVPVGVCPFAVDFGLIRI